MSVVVIGDHSPQYKLSRRLFSLASNRSPKKLQLYILLILILSTYHEVIIVNYTSAPQKLISSYLGGEKEEGLPCFGGAVHFQQTLPSHQFNRALNFKREFFFPFRGNERL